MMNRLEKCLLNLKAIQFARLSSAQDSQIPVVGIDNEANKALDDAIEILENISTQSDKSLEELIREFVGDKAEYVKYARNLFGENWEGNLAKAISTQYVKKTEDKGLEDILKGFKRYAQCDSSVCLDCTYTDCIKPDQALSAIRQHYVKLDREKIIEILHLWLDEALETNSIIDGIADAIADALEEK